jgi:hypothetical protein
VAHCFDKYGLDLVPDRQDIVTWPQDIARSDCLDFEATLVPDPDDPWAVTFPQTLRKALPQLVKRASRR